MKRNFLLFVLLSFPTTVGALPKSEDEKIDAVESSYWKLLWKYQKLEKKLQSWERVVNVPALCEGRLTPVSGVPVNTAVANTNYRRIYFTPYVGNHVALYYSGKWKLVRFSELQLDLNLVQATTEPDSNYDIFIYLQDDRTPALELSAAWSNDNTRSEALTQQDGVLVKAADPTRRYLGTVRTNANSDPERFNDHEIQIGLWNYYNRVPRLLRRVDATNTWIANNNSWAQANISTVSTNFVSAVIGVDEAPVQIKVKSNVISNDTTARNASVGIGVDSSSVNSANLMGAVGNSSSTLATQLWASYFGHPGIGQHNFIWLEICPGCTTTPGEDVTFWGDNGNGGRVRSGIIAELEG